MASKCYQSSPCQPTGPSETLLAKLHLVLVISAPQKLTQRGAEKTAIRIVLEETVTARLTYSGKMKAEKTSDCCMWINQKEPIDHIGTNTKPFCE